MFIVTMQYNKRVSTHTYYTYNDICQTYETEVHDTAIFTIDNAAPFYDEKKGTTDIVTSEDSTHPSVRLTGRWRIDRKDAFYGESRRRGTTMIGPDSERISLFIELEYDEKYTDYNEAHVETEEIVEPPRLNGWLAKLLGLNKPTIKTVENTVYKEKTRTHRVWVPDYDIKYESEYTYVNDCNAGRDQ